jgi:hypothetical protein
MQTKIHPPRLIRGVFLAVLSLALGGLLVSGVNAGTSNPNTFTVETFPLGAGSAVGMAYDGTNIWVVLGGNSQSLLKVASDGTILATYPVGRSPQYVVFDGTNMWVTSFGAGFDPGTVTKLRVSDGKKLGHFTVGVFPLGVTF